MVLKLQSLPVAFAAPLLHVAEHPMVQSRRRLKPVVRRGSARSEYRGAGSTAEGRHVVSTYMRDRYRNAALGQCG